MPTLNWIVKEAVGKQDNKVPFHLLQCRENLSAVEGNGNLQIQGDNLPALKTSMPYHAGMVKCIHIDPPYNIGKIIGFTTTTLSW